MDLKPCNNIYPKDSLHKWKNYEKILLKSNKNNIINLSSFKSVCDVGCSSGDILNLLCKSKILKNLSKIDGYDINSKALDLARNNFPHINFYNKDLFKANVHYDLLLCSDVFEHVSDVYSFLSGLKDIAKYFLFNIPLECSLARTMTTEHGLRKSYTNYGHLHFYSAASAILTLELSGYKIIKKEFAKDKTKNLYYSKSLKKLIKALPPLILEQINPYLSAAIFGDHLVVFAKSN